MRQVQTHPFVRIKLHTVHHTTEDLSQWMAFTREERNHFKEHLLWSSSRALADVLQWEEAAPEKTLISWFLYLKMLQKEAVQSWISGCWELSLKAKRRAASSPPSQQRHSESAVSSISRLQLLKASWWEGLTKRKYLGHTFEMNVVDSHESNNADPKHQTFLNTAADCENEAKWTVWHLGKYTHLISRHEPVKEKINTWDTSKISRLIENELAYYLSKLLSEKAKKFGGFMLLKCKNLMLSFDTRENKLNSFGFLDCELDKTKWKPTPTQMCRKLQFL